MSRFQAIQGNSVLPAFDLHREMSSRFNTLYGPSYGLCSGFLVPLSLMYTYVQS